MSECGCENGCGNEHEHESWEEQLEELLPLYGHRNWIVVADAAYPMQSKPGIDTTIVDASQIDAVKLLLAAIGEQQHIRANVYVDAELDFMAETDAPGVTAYRAELKAALGDDASRLPHETIIAKLDKAAEAFHVLVLKTEMTIPYTSVFFELDCGYWTPAAEERLRTAMAAAEAKK